MYRFRPPIEAHPTIENYYGPVGVVYYRLMAAWAKERDLPPSEGRRWGRILLPRCPAAAPCCPALPHMPQWVPKIQRGR